jgi:hypothetical protein
MVVVAERENELLATGALDEVAGSPKMRDLVAEHPKAILAWGSEQFLAFSMKYHPGAADTAGWEHDSALFADSIDQLLDKIGKLDDDFIDQGRKDLR